MTNRQKLEALAWRCTHRDYRGKTDGQRSILYRGALWKLSEMTIPQLVEYLLRSERELCSEFIREILAS